MKPASDTAEVIIWPPLLAISTLLVGIALDWLIPLGALALVPIWPRVALGFALAVLGGLFAKRAMGVFELTGTNVEPWKPSLALATAGIYARTRNPMYAGLGLLTLGAAVAFASAWTLLLMIPAAAVLHFGVVLREERYLAAKFGEEYRRYRQVVPRYFWRF